MIKDGTKTYIQPTLRGLSISLLSNVHRVTKTEFDKTLIFEMLFCVGCCLIEEVVDRVLVRFAHDAIGRSVVVRQEDSAYQQMGSTVREKLPGYTSGTVVQVRAVRGGRCMK